MTEIVGALATVDISEVAGGYAWDCRKCKRYAGRPLPGEEWTPEVAFRAVTMHDGRELTAEEFVTRAATNHAERVCAG